MEAASMGHEDGVAAGKLKGPVVILLGLLLWLCMCTMTRAQEGAGVSLQTCVDCHTVQVSPNVHLIFKTPHGAGRTEDGTVCSSCHGSSLAHREDPLRNKVDIAFANASLPAEQTNAVCLSCHKGGARLAWQGSVHHKEDMDCLGCHRIHVAEDPVMNPVQQDRVCFTCHKDVQAQLHLPSAHPIEQGTTPCSACHNAHGSTTQSSLNGITLNDTCYTCHAEKRGPFLFEHAPAAEDCSLCHRAHGAVNPDLLTARTPFLCQQCHSMAFHPGALNDGAGLPGTRPNPSLLGKNCMNCHSQVHGSNHPSGGRLTR